MPTAPSLNNRQHQTPASYSQQFAAPVGRVSAPSPAPSLARSNSYASQINETHRHQMPHSPHASFPQASYPHQSTQLLPQHSSTPAHSSYDQHRSSTSRSAIPAASSNTYNPPRPVEVYHLSDTVNNAIPQDIREQFQRDEFGHVLFFTAPPLDVSRIPEPVAKLGHSVKYLAKKARNKAELERKRKERDELRASETDNSPKRSKLEIRARPEPLSTLELQAVELLSNNIDSGTQALYQSLYGDEWEIAKQADEARLLSVQEAETIKVKTIEKHEQEREAARQVKI